MGHHSPSAHLTDMNLTLTSIVLLAVAGVNSALDDGQYDPGKYTAPYRYRADLVRNPGTYQRVLTRRQPINSGPGPNRLAFKQNDVLETYREFSTPKRDGSYSSSFSTDDGTSVRMAVAPSKGHTNDFLDVRGFHSYATPEGIRITTNWVANEKGYQPKITFRYPRQW